jgi:hypothetical protein
MPSSAIQSSPKAILNHSYNDILQCSLQSSKLLLIRHTFCHQPSPLMISTGNYPECLVLILLILFNVNISSNNIQEFRNLKPTLIRIVILLIQKSEHVLHWLETIKSITRNRQLIFPSYLRMIFQTQRNHQWPGWATATTKMKGQCYIWVRLSYFSAMEQCFPLTTFQHKH